MGPTGGNGGRAAVEASHHPPCPPPSAPLLEGWCSRGALRSTAFQQQQPFRETRCLLGPPPPKSHEPLLPLSSNLA